MKKSTFLKLALVSVAMLMFVGVNAQAILTDYSEDNTTTMYQTAGTNFRVYVYPDLVYSPSYVEATNANINVNSTWQFVISAGLTEVNPADISSPIAQNWVELEATTAGTQTVTAAEGNSVTGCDDSTPVSQTVEVIDAPTAVIAGTTANVNYTWSAAGTVYTDCLPAVTGTETVTVTITEDAQLPAALRAYGILINETVENLEADLVTPVAPALFDTDWDYTLAAKLVAANPAIPGTHTWTPNDVGTATSTYVFATRTLDVLNSEPTRYTYTIAQASDGPGAGIVSAISEKSDYLAGAVTPYAFGAVTTISYIVLPAPVTGPIYHVPNDYAL